jgi:hypothetical protein
MTILRRSFGRLNAAPLAGVAVPAVLGAAYAQSKLNRIGASTS